MLFRSEDLVETHDVPGSCVGVMIVELGHECLRGTLSVGIPYYAMGARLVILIAVSSLAAVALLVSGMYYFRRMEKTFADVV